MDEAFRKVKGPKDSKTIWCPCSKCRKSRKRTKEVMAAHLHNFGFTRDYSEWTFYSETCRMRSEVMRQCIRELDGDAGLANMIHDFHEAHFQGERLEEEPEPSAKAYYDMLAAAQKTLHKHTNLSQLDSIGRLMAVKSQHNLSRECFDALVTIFGDMLPEDHILPKNMYEAQKVLQALKMPYEKIHACPNGCVLFRKDHEKGTHCPKCKASRYIEVDSGEGCPKTQRTTLVSVLRYLPPISWIQWMYIIKESAKQMTWHKTGRRYSDNLTHPSDVEEWTKFDEKHADKAGEARNVRVALATDGFNPYAMLASLIHLLARVCNPPQSTPRHRFSMAVHIRVVDNSWILGR
jgi:hypothetical protein